VQIGKPAVEPLLQLLEQRAGQDPGDILFLLASLGVRDPRIFQALIRRLDEDIFDAALGLEIHGDPAALPALQAALARLSAGDERQRQALQSAIDHLSGPASDSTAVPEEAFDIWGQYPERSLPEFDVLDDDARLAMLDGASAELRAGAARTLGGGDLPLKARARLLEHAQTDPDNSVRGACWQALGDASEEPELRRQMLGVIANASASLEEKAGATVALAEQSDNRAVFEAIEGLYHDPRGRAMALKAMARSLDRRFAAYPAKHLDDPDPEIKTQAIWAVGYLNLSAEALRVEALFDDDEFRTPALFAYALAAPGETSRGRVKSLLNKIEDLAGGFSHDEAELVQVALDQRLMLHGHKPVFFPEESNAGEDAPAPPASTKIGRNDPCPCGSGKKYKKCCGA